MLMNIFSFIFEYWPIWVSLGIILIIAFATKRGQEKEGGRHDPEKAEIISSLAWKTFLWSGVPALIVIILTKGWATLIVLPAIFSLVAANAWSIAILHDKKAKKWLLLPLLVAMGVPVATSWALLYWTTYYILGPDFYIGPGGGLLPIIFLGIGHIIGILNGIINGITSKVLHSRYKKLEIKK